MSERSEGESERPRPSFLAAGGLGRGSAWLYLLGSVIIALLYFAASYASVGVYWGLTGGEIPAGGMMDVPGLHPAIVLAVLLWPSLILLLAPLVVARVVHGRSPVTLVRATGGVRWRRVGLGAAVWLSVAGVSEAVAVALSPENYEWSFEAGAFLPVLVVAVALLPLQSAGEEIFFRGYLMQGLGFAWKRPWLALVSTSTIFGLIHTGNPEVGEFGGSILGFYVAIGLVLGLVTLLDDGLELAIGAHSANNVFSAVVLTFPGSVLDTPSLWRMKSYPLATMMALGGATMALFLIVLARRLGWTSWERLLRWPRPRAGEDA